ncbi:MAG: hypothetical protein ABIL76_06775 [candidate division WOR-3 bacterium]
MAIRPDRETLETTVNFIILGNSVTVKEGDAITVATSGGNAGYAVPVSGAGQRVLGVVRNIRKADGSYIKDSEGRVVESVTTSSTNITTEKIGVEFYPAWLPIYFVADTSANLGTTAGSNTPGFFNILASDASVVNEASFVRSESATPEQIISHGRYEQEPRKILCRFNPKMIL